MSTPATKDSCAPTPERIAELDAWVGLLRAHAAATRRFNRELMGSHGLTINDFEVLVHLAHADGGRLRRVDLADRVLLTASGITRLLDGLERSKLVCKASCSADARVTYAEITPAGRALLADAAISSAFVGSVISETVASNGGIGYLMAVAASDFNTRLAFGGLIVLAGMGVVLYGAFAVIERRMTAWAYTE